MDEQTQKYSDTQQQDDTTPPGGGVNIEQSEEGIDDIEIESYNDDITSGGEMTPEDRIKSLKLKLRECAREKQEYLDGWQRLKADFANYKKREEGDKEGFVKFAREGLITDLLPVLESFHMAFANKEAWEKVDPAWRTGVEYIHTQLVQVLGSYGLTEIDPLGADFNPMEHESIGIISTTDTAKYHKIAEVVQLGYRLAGKMVRPPKVRIYGEEEAHATL